MHPCKSFKSSCFSTFCRLRGIRHRIPNSLSKLHHIPKFSRNFTIPSTMTTATGQSLANGNKPLNGEPKKFNAWQQPGPASYDFRSDVMTTPTESMLNAITNTTLLDDVYVEDTTTNNLEANIARLTGHEAALLVMSGTMGNQVALRTHLGHPPHSVLTDIRGHVFVYEAGGVATNSGALVIPVAPSNNHHLTLEDIKKHVILSNDVHACPTRVISLENTLNGMIMPLSEAQRISEFAREHGIIMHCDGARLWEACSADAGGIDEFSKCFDSLSLCFSKGLGAPIGSIIVGSKAFITRARHIRKMMGGGVRQAGVISAAATVAWEETFGSGPRGEGGQLRASHQRARQLEKLWVSKGGKLVHPVETNMVWMDIAAAGVSVEELAEMAHKEGLKIRGGRLVIHYQITEDSCARLERVMDAMLTRRTADDR